MEISTESWFSAGHLRLPVLANVKTEFLRIFATAAKERLPCVLLTKQMISFLSCLLMHSRLCSKLYVWTATQGSNPTQKGNGFWNTGGWAADILPGSKLSPKGNGERGRTSILELWADRPWQLIRKHKEGMTVQFVRAICFVSLQKKEEEIVSRLERRRRWRSIEAGKEDPSAKETGSWWEDSTL